MTVRPIVITGDPVLHSPTRTVDRVDDDLRTLVDDMFETMQAAHGVGLAANQIGVDLRLFVYDCPNDEGNYHRGLFLNPEIETTERPDGMPDPDDDYEGCLSVPGEAFPTGRADWAKVTGTDLDGNTVTLEGNGFLARMLQHEVDHLDGYIYLDRLVGRHKRTSKRALRSRGWEERGVRAWDPSELQSEDV